MLKENRKMAEDWIAPRVREIAPSGIRAFLISLPVTTILYHWA